MQNLAKPLYLIGAISCLLPGITPPMALGLGIAYGLIWMNPWPQAGATISRYLLQAAVVGLGFGVPLAQVWQVGQQSFFITLLGILVTIGAGWTLGRWLKVPHTTGMLVACGTAICGGSAIAAIAPVLRAKNDESAVALATVFTLNAVALLLFPLIGHLLSMEQNQFGVWAGMAIHDTSSVVGAAASYGAQALETATMVKLTRALWIVPVALVAGMLAHSDKRAKVPRFILLFIVAAALHSSIPTWQPLWDQFSTLAKHALVASLFFIGSSLNRPLLRKVGGKVLLQGTMLWLFISALTLAGLHLGWI
ncbi:MAG: putative sulfate exporter family transporter [Desulfuromonas sp.]|nr:putative sulfate exporter family transporter [Desulfuromonas sp.]